MKLLYWIYGFVVLAIVSGIVLIINYQPEDFTPKITLEQIDSVIVIDTVADFSNSKQENHENTQ